MTWDEIKKANEALDKIVIERQDKKTGQITKKNYAMVNDRIKAFRSVVPNGSIMTEIVQMDDDLIVMTAKIYDGSTLLATGTAFEQKQSSYINKTSYIENCETSAVGRALGFCGFGIDDSMASAEEVANAMKQQEVIKEAEKTKIGELKAKALESLLGEKGVSVDVIYSEYGVTKLKDLTEVQHASIVRRLQKSSGNNGKAN